MTASWEESDDKPRQGVEKQRHYSADKGPYSQGYGLPSGHVLLWNLNRKESRMPKNWCLYTVVLKTTPESPLDSKEIKLVNTKGNQPWIFIGRTEAPIFWPPDVKSGLIGKITSCWKRLKAGGEGSDRELYGITQLNVKDREAWRATMRSQRVGNDLATER